jgi:enediyne biosynthesis protein E4
MQIPSEHHYLVFILLLFISCRAEQTETKPKSSGNNTQFILKSKEETKIGFANTVTDTKDFNILNYRNFYNGGGVAIGDINNDNLSDLFFTCNTCPEKLYLNKGNFQFEDISASAGIEGKDAWTTGVAMADVNGDGWLDIYVCYSGDQAGKSRENELFINQKNNTFKEEAAIYGLNDRGLTTHAAFFDYDLDGDLDCFMLNNSFKDIRKFDARTDSREIRDSLGGQRLYKNENGFFKDISIQANVYGSKIGFGLGISISDLNDDGYPDMYVSNDFFERDYLYINDKKGAFKEILPESIGHTSQFSMGSDIGDIDNDGRPDIFSTDMLPFDMKRTKVLSKFNEFNTESMRLASNLHNQYMQNCLQWNRGNLKFSEIACMAGVEATDWSWGALLFDMDNDGLQDIFVSNGIYKDITNMDFSDFLADKTNVDKVILAKGEFDFRDFLKFIPSTPLSNHAYLNEGNLKFKESAISLGLGEPSFSNGAAYGDLDNDGDYDLIVNNINAEASVYQNQSANDYISIELKGKNQNTFAIGAKVQVISNAYTQTKEVFINRGFQSSTDNKLIFGLKKNDVIKEIKIYWPDHMYSILSDPNKNRAYKIDQDSIKSLPVNPPLNQKPDSFLEKVDNIFVGNTRHREDNYIDFHAERLIPNMLSNQGPAVAVGDLNGDKLDDVLIGGAKGDYTKMFLQNAQGRLIEKKDRELMNDSIFEDTDLALYDHDADGSLDLLISSGGNEYPEGSEGLATRLYFNDGKANFLPMPMLSPPAHINTSCVRIRSLENGPTLLFLGGRSITKNYGLNPASYVMMNIAGKWTDITPEFLKRIGMVTDALWTDYNKDGYVDLIVVGEWMPITFIKNNGKSLEMDAQQPNSSGWWNSISEEDFNNDGFKDYIVGNWGLNSKFRASPEHPILMYVSDFDRNQQLDPIICLFNPVDNKTYPYSSRIDMITQMPVLKKDNLKYSEYAAKSFDQLFTEEQRKNAMTKSVNTLENCVLINDQGKSFRLETLPRQTQIAPIYASIDLGGNNYWVAGNFYKSKPEIGRMDASYGHLLHYNQSDSKFELIDNNISGIYLTGEVRDIKPITIKGQKHIIVAYNDAPVSVYKVKI